MVAVNAGSDLIHGCKRIGSQIDWVASGKQIEKENTSYHCKEDQKDQNRRGFLSPGICFDTLWQSVDRADENIVCQEIAASQGTGRIHQIQQRRNGLKERIVRQNGSNGKQHGKQNRQPPHPSRMHGTRLHIIAKAQNANNSAQ